MVSLKDVRSVDEFYLEPIPLELAMHIQREIAELKRLSSTDADQVPTLRHFLAFDFGNRYPWHLHVKHGDHSLNYLIHDAEWTAAAAEVRFPCGGDLRDALRRVVVSGYQDRVLDIKMVDAKITLDQYLEAYREGMVSVPELLGQIHSLSLLTLSPLDIEILDGGKVVPRHENG